ncbi:FG-GAP repeat domain-containing protein [Thiocapsa bogorovii]|uniref:FG-GAP repeat domain-containing protein n=1 Tax=Thiocapsa bogorovii TaxID=521689 RepID=UPI001E5E702E|nr:VCBS repeat-containing protein [Thiocapsa bogorovii]UHD14529.1 VCBS repeat-containing protein [Thiocapsa bogorovii]
MSLSRPFGKAFSYPILFSLLGGLAGCDSEPPPQAAAESPAQRLPFNAIAFDVLADDIDGNGLLDLAFTTHHASYTQVFLQTSPRVFAPGPKIEEVGFHPGDLMRLPGEDPRLYLMNAEGVNALRVFEPGPGGSLGLVAQMNAPAPRVSAFFRWPDAGLGLAVAPFAQSTLLLIKDFKGATAARGLAYGLQLDSQLSQIHQVAAADLDGDGSDEILFPEPRSHRLNVVRAPSGDDVPTIEVLWTFEQGGMPRHIVVADADGNGTPDLLVPDEVATPSRRAQVNVLLNDGTGQLTPVSIPFPSTGENAKGVKGIRSIAFGQDEDGAGYLLAAAETHLALMRIPQGWSGEALESRILPFAPVGVIRKMLLVDLDGDGALDAVLGRTGSSDSGYILYGPLWDTFESMTAAGVPID